MIRHGLTAAGRYLVLRIALADRPGELHRLTGVLAGLGLNVVDIEHHRSGVTVAVGVSVTQPEWRFAPHRLAA